MRLKWSLKTPPCLSVAESAGESNLVDNSEVGFFLDKANINDMEIKRSI